MIFNQMTDDTKAEVIVPPRPNLGPEPWPEASRWNNGGSWAITAIVLLIMLGAYWWRRARRRRQRLIKGPLSADLMLNSIVSDRERWIESSDRIRNGMVDAFGPGWRSKTTEEISEDSALSERLEIEERLRLIAFLTIADRVKFAEDLPEPLEQWETWAETIVGRFGAPRTIKQVKKKGKPRKAQRG